MFRTKYYQSIIEFGRFFNSDTMKFANLLQLADYISGIVNRSVQRKKKKSENFRKMIAHREIRVQIWPKLKENS